MNRTPLDTAALVGAELPPSVRVGPGQGGLPRLVVANALGTAEVYFQGAHVSAWRPEGQDTPVLWMSRQSAFETGKPLRGGVPICFPWFGAHARDASAPAHGFARVRPWTLVGAREDAAGTLLELELSGEALSPAWPFAFRAVHRIHVGTALRLELEVGNPGAAPFTFEEALHTYLAVDDVRNVSLDGLEETEYLDKVAGFGRRHQPRGPVRITGETDRIYLDTEAACVLRDPGRWRRITIAKQGSRATVVWNPWVAKARAMPDFGDDEWPEMICVETGNVNAHAVTLPPGGRHTMMASIEADALPGA